MSTKELASVRISTRKDGVRRSMVVRTDLGYTRRIENQAAHSITKLHPPIRSYGPTNLAGCTHCHLRMLIGSDYLDEVAPDFSA